MRTVIKRLAEHLAHDLGRLDALSAAKAMIETIEAAGCYVEPVRDSVIAKDCAHCGEQFRHKRSQTDRMYCSKSCRARAENGPWQDRFWQKVDKRSEQECWNWIGGINRATGYGYIRILNKSFYPHRISVEIHQGITLQAGDVVCHKCDNPKCVNPNHLFVGTHTDNMRDMWAKGRGKAPHYNPTVSA